MKLSKAFPSKFLTQDDLGDRTVKVTIDNVRMEDVGDDHNPVVYFQGKQKGLSLNKTNGEVIAEHYGDETDNWGGVEIELYVDPHVMYRGKRTGGIRVRLTLPPAAEEGQEGDPPF